jgi:hypothetical protein
MPRLAVAKGCSQERVRPHVNRLFEIRMVLYVDRLFFQPEPGSVAAMYAHWKLASLDASHFMRLGMHRVVDHNIAARIANSVSGLVEHRFHQS